MSASPINKYVVNVNGVPCQLNEYGDTPKGGILLIATPATIFPNRRAARIAVSRTLEYAKANGFPWKEKEYDIYRLQENLVYRNKQNFRSE